MVGNISFFLKAVNSLDDDDVRISKRLYIPSSRLRGFEKGKVGPKDGMIILVEIMYSTLNFSTNLPQFCQQLKI